VVVKKIYRERMASRRDFVGELGELFTVPLGPDTNGVISSGETILPYTGRGPPSRVTECEQHYGNLFVL
jgi:hypothetical protein